ncbi:MAG: polysaccharide deacetylase family protein [Nitriliruptor sp.]|uniref:polysaccharide deacetylase family protein n=1 Tax=Nitriliruptor sp. TaxID=2448056 RepID=UPI0034A01DBE
MPLRTTISALLVLALLGAACGEDAPRETPPSTEPSAAPDDGGPADEEEPEEVVEEAPDPAAAAAEVEANELGQIPVLMYHRLLPDGGGDYDNTPEQFEAELRRLHDEGYVPITTAELVSGRIDVPAGTTPVVLTFDDSTREQFALTEDGEVDPDTAVGIMLRLEDELDGFEAAGSFYVLGSLFGANAERGAELLAALADLGFEIGNHTAGHENLRQLDAEGVQCALAGGVANIQEAVPGTEVRTLSYPFGVRPEDPTLVASGSADGVEYTHLAGLLVGSGPAPSPYDATFDPLAIPRIRSQPEPVDGDPDFGSNYWLEVLAEAPERRYVSDGDPDTIAFPSELRPQLAPDHEDRAVAY